MEKRYNKNFMLSPGCRYLEVQGKLLRRATTSVNGRIISMLESKKKWELQTYAKAESHFKPESMPGMILNQKQPYFALN